MHGYERLLRDDASGEEQAHKRNRMGCSNNRNIANIHSHNMPNGHHAYNALALPNPARKFLA
jgi:hypothetical protein